MPYHTLDPLQEFRVDPGNSPRNNSKVPISPNSIHKNRTLFREC